MSILIEALSELYVSAANYVPGARSTIFSLNGWQIILTGHGSDRESLRHAEPELDELIERTIARLTQLINRITRPGEYLFFSKSLRRGIVCNVDTGAKQLRITTVLPTGRDFAKEGTRQVIIEGVQYEIIEID